MPDPLTADAIERATRLTEAQRLEAQAATTPFPRAALDLLAIAEHHRTQAARLAQPNNRRAAA